MCLGLVVQLDVMGDPGKLRVSTPALLYKVYSHAYRNVVVSMFVADLIICSLCVGV